ncbi:MAG TPA: YkgJ family cysteine cluster protein [Pseudomonas sp.]|uniref:YkgJ family cysteine cluster protein n=1 Tax=Pseudomonas sp. TaxID=306 RepID=UPI002ED7F2C4
MECRSGCGACCIAPSISSPIPGMPQGKPAGERCLHLSVEMLCALFGRPERPVVCGQFKADPEVCGNNQQEAIRLIGWWEHVTTVAC